MAGVLMRTHESTQERAIRILQTRSMAWTLVALERAYGLRRVGLLAHLGRLDRARGKLGIPSIL